MKNPIYVPKGAAKEYGDYALNIYTGCPHRCYYCFAPGVLHKEREAFHSEVRPRDGILEATKEQLACGGYKGKTIHLCFSCDPYPCGYDTSVTRTIIEAIKNSGNHVQILTKSGETRDFDLLDGNDWFGITYAGYEDNEITAPEEPYADTPQERLIALYLAHRSGIKTWISIEPVLNERDVFRLLNEQDSSIDRYKIGKLNYHPSSINWREFGQNVERICKAYGYDYYIKAGLRAEMKTGT